MGRQACSEQKACGPAPGAKAIPPLPSAGPLRRNAAGCPSSGHGKDEKFLRHPAPFAAHPACNHRRAGLDHAFPGSAGGQLHGPGPHGPFGQAHDPAGGGAPSGPSAGPQARFSGGVHSPLPPRPPEDALAALKALPAPVREHGLPLLLHALVKHTDNHAVLSRLLRSGSPLRSQVNARDASGRTPLHLPRQGRPALSADPAQCRGRAPCV